MSLRRSISSRATAVGLRWASAERVALAGMLLVVLPATVALFPTGARFTVPPTLLATVGYWLVGKTLRSDSALVPYAIIGGALAGYMNMSAAVHLHLWPSGQYQALAMSGLYCLIFGFFGCFHGVGYGLFLLPPVWLARRARRFHAAEATDRVLAGTGLWGLVGLAIAVPLSDELAIKLSLDATAVEPAPMWGVAAVGCLSMFVLGVERLRERRTWLARVRQGKVAGWLVLSPEQVGEGTGELPVFCSRLFRRKARENMILAEGGASKGAYRSESPIPRFRVG